MNKEKQKKLNICRHLSKFFFEVSGCRDRDLHVGNGIEWTRRSSTDDQTDSAMSQKFFNENDRTENSAPKTAKLSA